MPSSIVTTGSTGRVIARLGFNPHLALVLEPGEGTVLWKLKSLMPASAPQSSSLDRISGGVATVMQTRA
ncbi:hypothetical protein AOLI_G00075630 [Acnodon oligacanthus]